MCWVPPFSSMQQHAWRQEEQLTRSIVGGVFVIVCDFAGWWKFVVEVEVYDFPISLQGSPSIHSTSNWADALLSPPQSCSHLVANVNRYLTPGKTSV